MKILIVDDDNGKATQIQRVFLSEESGKCKIEVATSINDAVNKLMREKYQLVIVDMCLPENFGSNLMSDGGLQLIKALRKDKRIIAPGEIIVLTAYNNLLSKYKNDIEKESFSMICYNDSSEEWKQKLLDKFRYLSRQDESPKEVREYKYDLAILTAVPVEDEAIKNISDKWARVEVEGDSTVYFETELKDENRICKVVTTRLTQMGMVAAATITSKMIFNFAPRFIVMPGIAGGVREEYEFGDIIVPKEVKDYCSGKYTTPEKDDEFEYSNPLKYFIPTSSSISTNFDIINLVSQPYEDVLQNIHKKWSDCKKYKAPQIRTGYMASGDSVVQNDAVIELMIKNHLRQADGLDMEAYGMYYAAKQAINPKPIPICMKAISDFANKDKSNEHQSYASFVSAQFMKFFVLNVLMDRYTEQRD